jgi:hypothetical protein
MRIVYGHKLVERISMRTLYVGLLSLALAALTFGKMTTSARIQVSRDGVRPPQ